MTTKRSIILFCVFIVFCAIIFYYSSKSSTPSQTATLPAELCYYKETTTASGFKDIDGLKMNINGSNVTGEVHYLPAEKDSETGTFEGTFGSLNPATNQYTADTFWNLMGEGMQTKEQLRIVFNQGMAGIGFGEMVDQGDGTFDYKDASNLSYVAMPIVDCATFDSHFTQPVAPIVTQ